MEQTDAALARLAEQLGISVSELWGWLQGNGVKAYAAARITQSLTVVIMALIFFVICLCFFRFFCRKYTEWESVDRDPYLDGNPFITHLILIPMLALGCFFVFAINLPDLIGWIVSPEGMVIGILVGC